MGIVIKKTIQTSIINYAGVLLGLVNILWFQVAIISEFEIGILKYIGDIAILFLPLILLGTSGVPARFIHQLKTDNEKEGFVFFLLLVPIVTISTFSLIVFFFKSQIIELLGDDIAKISNYLIFIIPLLTYSAYQYILESLLLTKTHILYSSFFKNIFRRLVLITLLIIHYYNIIDFYTMVLLYILSHGIDLIFLFIYFTKYMDIRLKINLSFFSHPLKKEIFIYSLYLIIGVGGIVFVNKIDTLMIEGITGSLTYLGIYTISFFIASVIEIPKRIVYQLSFPIISKNTTENKTEELQSIYTQSSSNLTLFAILFFLLVWLNIDELFMLIPNGDKYAAGKWVLFFIGLSKIFDVFFGTSDLLINATKYYKSNAYLLPFLALLTIGTNYYFITMYGYVGAAIATSITICVFSIIRYLIVLFYLKMNSISKAHFTIIINVIIVSIVFYLKPPIIDNSFIEIIVNAIIIMLLFVGGNYFMKSSIELNTIIDNGYKKIKSIIKK